MKPTLTVGITYHNEKELITRCLKSLLEGDNAPEEILVVDDSSQTPPGPYLPQDSRVRVIRLEENQGPAKARNVILRQAQGEFLHFHDSDDWFLPQWASRVRRELVPGVDAVFSEINSYKSGAVYGRSIVGLSALKAKPDLVSFCLSHVMLVPAGTYRTEFLRALGGYRESLWQSEDFDFHVRLAAKVPKFVVIDEPLVEIDVRPESRSQRFHETRVDAFKALQALATELPPEYGDEIAEAAARVGSELFACGDRDAAQAAFSFSSEVGRAKFAHRRGAYRVLAGVFGPLVAERLTAFAREVRGKKRGA